MKKLAVIGDPIEHSLSPVIHNAALKNLNLDKEFSYEKIRVEKEALKEFCEKIRNQEFTGVNVTIPHKTSIIKFLDELTIESENIGSVNTIYIKGKKLVGHSTDGEGCVSAFKERGVELINKKIAVIGAGGASRSIVFSLQKENPENITIFNRTFDKAKNLAEEIIVKTRSNIEFLELSEKNDYSEFDILINTTSVGMKEDKSPVSSETFKKDLVVMDIVYNPIETRLLKEAKSKGCITIDGTGMLVNQGALSFKIWTGKEAPKDIMKNALVRALKGNISLIGFMGTGKSSVGKVLAEKTGKRFIEIDDIIEQKAGKKINEIFNDEGEKRFRELESKVIEDVLKDSDQVISCGGGVVVRDENIKQLREKSIVVLLESSDKKILERVSDSKKRPLLESVDREKEIQRLKKERSDNYENAADIKIINEEKSLDDCSGEIINKIISGYGI